MSRPIWSLGSRTVACVLSLLACGGHAAPNIDSPRDLSQRFLNYSDATFNPKEFQEMGRSILLDPSFSDEAKDQLLIAYADRFRKGRGWVVAALCERKSSALPGWLETHRGELSGDDWGELEHAVLYTWTSQRDRCPESLRKVLVQHATFARNGKGRIYALLMVEELGATLDETVTLSHGVEKLEDGNVRISIYELLTRYNDPRTNTLLRKFFRDDVELRHYEGIISDDLVQNARYDFIPDLLELKQRWAKRDQAAADPRARDEHRSLLQTIDRAVEQLEEKKRDEVPIGKAFTPQP